MKKISKIGLLMLSFALICAGIVMSVSGAEQKNGKASYVDSATGETMEGTLAEAWENAATDTVITLLGNCEMEEKLTLNGKNLTVDIGKFTLTSTDTAAFELKKETSITVVGSGTIALEGMLATSTAENVTFLIEGTKGTKGIDIDHTGFMNNRIVYTEFGSWTFKNIDVYSTVQGKDWHCFFEMRNVTTVDVDFVFDTVAFEYATPYVSHPGQFVTNVAGTGHLTVKNSSFVTEHSGIKAGVVENLGEEVIFIENSLISCVTDAVSLKALKGTDVAVIEKDLGRRNYAILGMNDKWEGSPKGIVNVKGSFLESNYRTVCYENQTATSNSVINFTDSTVRVIGLNGNDDSENITRAIMVNTFGNTVFLNIKEATAGSTSKNSEIPYVVVEAGFRTNIRGITTSTKNDTGVKVLGEFYKKDKDGNNTEEIEERVDFACLSLSHTWVYDPIGNPDAPYLLVKNEDAVGYADAYKFAGFDTYRFAYVTDTVYDEYLVYKDGVSYKGTKSKVVVNGSEVTELTKEGWFSYEPFGQTNGNGNPNSGSADNKSKNKMENFHWAQRGGTYLIAGDSQNKYMKYWVEPSATDPDAERVTLAGSDAPFWIVGEMAPSSANDFKYVKTMVKGDTRKAVMVIDIDFGSESGVYPDLNLKFASRYKTDTKYDQSAQINTSWFEIRNGGTVKNNLGTTGTDLTAVPTPVLKGANEWNHLSIVFYSDPNYEGGLGYVYLNGELMGTQAFYLTSANDTVYLQGLRFDIPRSQIADSDLCIDNMSLRCYNNYQVDGEADGAKKSPEKYIIAKAPGTYINSSLTVVGNNYRGASLEELQAKAEKLESLIRLQDDFSGSVKTDTTIYTNGYEINPTEDSYAANVVYDENSGSSLYNFNKIYNDLSVKYYWYVGEYGNVEQMMDVTNPDCYLVTTVTPGQIPEYTGGAMPNVEDLNNASIKVHCGWHSAGDDFTVETFVPLTLSAAIAQKEKNEPIYVYPSYYLVDPTAYIKDASGKVVDVAEDAYEASDMFTKLDAGQTFVVCKDFQFEDSKVNTVFRKASASDMATYGAGVTTSNSTEKNVIDYTDEQLTAMREASAKLALDLNGHTIKVGHATKRGSLLSVSSNVTFSVYSSQPGGMIYSVQGESGTGNINGNRILDMYYGDEKGSYSFDTTNAHLVVGTVEVDGEVIPGSNLTLYGCVLVEARTGDNSCTVEVDGIRAIRHNPDSAGAFMARFFSGKYTVTNTTIIAPTSTSVISIKDDLKNNEGFTMTPEVRFENCLILNDGKSNILEHTGDDENNICLTLKNVITTGRISTSAGRGKVLLEGGVFAKEIQEAGSGVMNYASGISQAKYNVPFTLDAITDSGILEIMVPKELLDEVGNYTNVIDYEARRLVYVEEGKEALIPVGENVEVIALPKLAVGTGTNIDIVMATFMGLDGSVLQSESFIKGGMPEAPEVSDYELSALTKLVYLGKFDREVTAIQETTIFNPQYEIVNNVSGIKSSVSFYTSFNINIYVPYEYKDYFKNAFANGEALALSEVTVDDVQYVMCSMPVSANKFADSVAFELEFGEMIDLVPYKGITTITSSVLAYAEAILADAEGKYIDEDKTLVYAALAYANQAIIYASGEANDDVLALVNEYANLAAADSDDKYSEAKEETNLSAAFLKATVRLASSPAMVFTVQRDFVGTVKFTIGGVEREYVVEENNRRTIIIKDLTIAEFTSDILITVDGAIGDEAVVITDGAYNLATYAKYHIANSTYGENDIPTDSQLASEKAVAVIDAMYAYAAAAEAYEAE